VAAKTAPTRQGWIVVASSAVTLAMGRVFGVIELYFLAAAMVLAAIAAFLVVAEQQVGEADVRRVVTGGRPLHTAAVTEEAELRVIIEAKVPPPLLA
jgi:hypothetical protein